MMKVVAKKKKRDAQERAEKQHELEEQQVKKVEVVKRKKESRISGLFLLEIAAETLRRIAPDEITVFSDRVLTRDVNNGKTWLEPLGKARRMRKDDNGATEEFKLRAYPIVQALIDHQAPVARHEYADPPFCAKHK
jgi:hypothetical protein